MERRKVGEAEVDGEPRPSTGVKEEDVEARERELASQANAAVEVVEELIEGADQVIQEQLNNGFHQRPSHQAVHRQKGIEPHSLQENDELVVKRLLEAQQLAQRMALDGRLTLRGWKYWLIEEAERRRELEAFKRFQQQQIELAVKSESHKNHNEIRDRRVNLSELQLNLERVQKRVAEAKAERERILKDIARSKQLRVIVDDRTQSETSATEAVEQRLQEARDTLAAASRRRREAQAAWDALVARANEEQLQHANMIKDAESQLSRAQQLLRKQEMTEEPDDRTGALRAQIEEQIKRQENIRQQAQEAQEEKDRIKQLVSSLQDEVAVEQEAAEALADTYRDALQHSSREHEAMDAQMDRQRRALEEAQAVLARDADALREADDALFAEKQQVQATEAAIESAATTKGALQAEMQRIEQQYKLALAEYDRTTREVAHHRSKVKEMRENMALDERALKHRSKERAQDLEAERELHEYVNNALREVETKHEQLRRDRTTVLPKMEEDIASTTARIARLEETQRDLDARHKGACTRRDALREEHGTLRQQQAQQERELAAVEEQEAGQRTLLLKERDKQKERVESAPARHQEKIETLERLQAQAVSVDAHTAKLVEMAEERETEIADARAEVKRLVDTTQSMRARTALLEQQMEDNAAAHATYVQELKDETVALKKDTRRLVLENEPVARAFVKEQGASFGLRQTMAAEIARELEVEMQVQRQREALMQQQQYAYSKAVYALLQRHRQQLAASMTLTKQAAGESDKASAHLSISPS